MFKHYFENIEGISIYPIFSLVVFGLFFIGLGVFVYKLSNKYCSNMSDLPFEDSKNTLK